MKTNYYLISLVLVLLGFNVNSQLTAPFIESFNSTTFPATWNLSSTSGGPWTLTGTMGYAASGITDHTGTAGSTRAWMDFSGTDAGVIIASDTIDVSSVPKPELSFFFNNNLGTNVIDPLNILYVEGYDGTGWVEIDKLQQDNAGVWSEHYYDLCSFVLPGNKVLVRFRAESGGDAADYFHDLAIDDIKVDTLRVNCFNPQGLTADNITDFSAVFKWSAGCTDTAWSVKYDTSGFNPATHGTYVHTNVDTLLVNTLNDFVDYDFYVRSYCNLGDTSTWAGPFSFKTLPSCVAPMNQSATAITAYTATLKWDSGAGPNPDTAWSIKYDTMGFNPATHGTYLHVNVDSANITSLSPNTRYDFYVRGYCNSGDTSVWIGPFTFKTLCIVDTIPYLQAFSFWPPDCWSLAGGVNNWISSAAAPGIAEANFWGISSGDFHMTTHPIHLRAFSRLSFDWSHLYSSTYPGDSLEVQVKIDTATTWTRLWGFAGAALESNDGAGNTSPGSFKNEVINLDSATYTGKNVMVRFVAVSGFGPDLFVDNVILEEVPSCPRPTLIGHHALFSDSVALNWTNGPADSIWQVQYGAAGFALGTGTTITDPNDSISIGGLTPSTAYGVYVRSICTVGDTSRWEGPYQFTTPCSFYTPPYLEDFSTYTFSVNPTCWEEGNGLLTVASTVVIGPSDWTSDGFGNVGGSGAARMNIWSTGREDWLISPSIDLGTGTTPYQVEFDVALTPFSGTAASTFDPDDKFYLIISPDNGVTWSDTNILEKWDTGNTPSNTGDYFYYNLTAAGYTGQVKFALYGESSVSGADNNVYVDNFAVVQVPTCPRPLNLVFDSATQTTANISWTNGAADSAWILEYGAPGFTRGTGTIYNSSTNPAVIPGLSHSTCYDVYLRSICTVGDSSKWIGPLRFCTDCAPVFDLCEDFEGYNANELPICWSRFVSTTGSANVGIRTFGAHLGTNMVQLNAGNDASATLMLISPEMNALSAGTHRASFWLDGSFTPDTSIIIGTMSDPTNPATFTPWDTIKTVTNAYQRFRIPFDTYTGTDKHVAFLYNPTATFRSMSIDEFCFEVIPSCEKAPFVTVLNPGQDSNLIRLGWNLDTTQASFMTAYGPAGYDPITNPAGGDTVTTTSTLQQVSGLQPLTEYCFWVKAICKNGDTSAWDGPHCASTGCPSSTPLAYFQDFSTYAFAYPTGLPQCWEEGQGVYTSGTVPAIQNSQWVPDGFGNVGTDSAARMEIWSTNRNEWLISPSINLGTTTGRHIRIEYDVAATVWNTTAPATFGNDDSLVFLISRNNGVSWDNTGILAVYDTGNVPSATGDHIIIDLPNETGVVKFAFYATSKVSNQDNNVYIDNFHVYDSTFVGLEEIAEIANFKIFPNPNTGIFTILNEGSPIKSSIKIVDVQGRLVFDEAFFFNVNGRKQVDISSLNAGVYVLMIQSEGKLEQHRIIISK